MRILQQEKRSKWLMVSAISIAASLCAAPAYAQEAETSTVGDIVVTAQRRAQSVQDVPLAVSAFGADTLQERNVQDVAQLNNLTPNVTFDAGTPFSGSTSVLAASIRGIGQNDFAFNFDPGVGVYLDGVYLARSVGANTDLLDVERIEVLKGPQGTLFGRNAVGGAISIVTRDPGEEFGYVADITTGTFNRFDVRGSVDLPLAENLRAAVSFSTKHRSGYQERIPFPDELVAAGIPDCAATPTCEYVTEDIRSFPAAGFQSSEDEGGQGEWNGRIKLLWEMTPEITARFTADYTNVDQSAAANSLLRTTNIPGLPFGAPATSFASIYNACISTLDPSTVNFSVPFPPFTAHLGNVCDFRGTQGIRPGDPGFIPTALAGANVDGDPTNNRLPWDDRFVTGDPDTSYATGNSFSQLTQWGAAATFDWELASNLAFKSITAYRRQSWNVGMDLDGSPMQMLNISFSMHQHQFSQEFQLNGDAWDERLNYVLGAYYFEEEGDLHDFVTFHEGLLQIDGPNDLRTSAWAVFGQVNYRLTDQLGITLGLRYTEEDKEFEGFQADLNAFNYKIGNCYPPDLDLGGGFTCQDAAGFPVPGDPLRFFPAGVEPRSFDSLDPRIGVEYHISDDQMLYASWATGFKSGSWTTRLSAPLPAPPAPGSEDRLFDPEEASSYEIGLKSDLFDNTVRLNTAAFFTEYQNIQLNVFEGISPTFRNAGDAEMYGGEIELQAVFGEGFTLNSSVGYIHAEYTRKDPGVAAGDELPKTPEWSFNLAPQYELGLGGGASLLLLADYTYRSSVFNDTENNPGIARPDISLLNLSATYRSPDGNWEFGIGGTNVTDERYLVHGVAQPAGGWEYGTYNPPAEWYARLRIRN